MQTKSVCLSERLKSWNSWAWWDTWASLVSWASHLCSQGVSHNSTCSPAETHADRKATTANVSVTGLSTAVKRCLTKQIQTPAF